MSVRGSGRLWSSSEGSDRTDWAAAGWEACGLRGYGVLKRAPARSRTPEAGSSGGVNDRRTGSQPPAGDPAFS